MTECQSLGYRSWIAGIKLSDNQIGRGDDPPEPVGGPQRAAAGTADRHLATVDYVVVRVLEARQAWLANAIDGYRRFVSEAGKSLSTLDQAARNAAR